MIAPDEIPAGSGGPAPVGTRAAPTPAVADPASPEPPWRRLSPGMLLVEPVRELIRFIPMLLILIVAGSRGDGGPPWGLIGTAAVVALGVTRYLSTRYRITPSVVEVRRGLVQRRHLTVPRDRIRTVEVSAHPLQRLLRLVRVDVGTGSSHTHAATVRLDGLPAAAVPGLRAELLPRADPAADAGATTAIETRADLPAGTGTEAEAELETGSGTVEIARLRPRWFLLAPATLSGVVTGAVLIGFALRLLHQARVNPADLGPVQGVLQFLRGHSPAWDGLFAAGIVLLTVTVLSVAGYLLSYWGFRLVRQAGGTLHVSRGLLTTRTVSIGERRLHGVQRREPLVLRWARGARLEAVATGLRRTDGGDDGGGHALLVPPAPLTEVLRAERTILGDERLVDGELTAHGPAARRRRYLRALAGAAVLVLATAALTWWTRWPLAPSAGWLVPLTVVAGAAAGALAGDRYRGLGHSLVDGHLVTRVGALLRRRTVLATDGVIGVTIRQSPFQRRAGLATVIATTAAGAQRYDVPDLPAAAATRLAAAIVPVAAQFRDRTGSDPDGPVAQGFDEPDGPGLLR